MLFELMFGYYLSYKVKTFKTFFSSIQTHFSRIIFTMQRYQHIFFYLSILSPFHVYSRASKRLFYTAFRGFRACNIATTIANQNSYKSTGPSHVYFVLPRMCSKPLVGYVCIRKLCMCSVFTRSQNPVYKF